MPFGQKQYNVCDRLCVRCRGEYKSQSAETALQRPTNSAALNQISDKAENSEPKLLFEQNHVSRGCHPLVVIKDFYKGLMTPFLRPNAQLKGTGHHQNQKYIFLLLSI